MKLTFFILLFSVVSVFATNTYSQAKVLSIDLENSTIKEVLRNIEEQSEFYFMYSEKIIDVNRSVSVNVEQQKISKILDVLFDGTNIKYLIEDRFILLTTPEVSGQITGFIPQFDVTGSVTDEFGNPLPGVSVFIRGTTNGTITDEAGAYSISEVTRDAIIVFSFIGMKTQEIVVGNKRIINAVLVPDAIGLEELVVVGYGVQRKSDLTGAVSSVKGDQLRDTPLSRVDQALQGKMAGVSVTTTDGSPGGNVKIRIRGANSINGGNDPLVVVDGFLGGDLNTISPTDIESIEVLKDASATAIYGSRGSNGVILVTTKKGRKGKTEISFNSYMSNHKLANTVATLDPYEYASLVNERSAAFGRPLYFTEEQVDDFRINGGTDWEKEIYRDNALTHNSKLSVLGGGEKTRYYLSTNLMEQQGLIENNNFDRVGIVSNMDADLNDWITVGLNISGNKETNKGVQSSGYWGNPVDNALRFPNTTPVYNEDGTYGQEQPITLNGAYNPVATVFEPKRLATSIYGLINSYLKFNLGEYLSFRSSFGAKFRTSESDNFQTINTLNGKSAGMNMSSYSGATSSNWQNTNTLNYLRSFNGIHRVNATLVFEQQHEEYKQIFAQVGDFPTEALGFYNLSLGKEKISTSSDFYESDIQSFLGRVNYNLLERYLVTVSYRADGSSKFGEGNKWGHFPSASVAWRLSQEEFIKNLGIFSNLKLRTSYGITGSQATGPYSSLSRLGVDYPYPLDGSQIYIGIGPASRPPNPDLRWEKTHQLNIGLDMAFFNNRLAFVFNMYQKNTKDLLLNEPLPRYTGFTSKISNVGEVGNKGFEISLIASPLVNDFKWDLSMNFSANKTEVIELGRGGQIILGTSMSGSNREYILREGEELGSFYGYQFLGVWNADEADEAILFNQRPGDPRYLDFNNDSTINEDDKIILGSGQSKFRFGISNSFSYKGFDLSADIIGVQGNKILNVRRYLLNQAYRVPENQNYYTEDNQDTDVPRLRTSIDQGTADSRWLEDGSFIRLRNVTLGYTFRRNWMEKVSIGSARIYFSGQNLITITDYSGFDPEISSSGNSDTMIGYDATAYPSARIYTFGIDVKF